MLSHFAFDRSSPTIDRCLGTNGRGNGHAMGLEGLGGIQGGQGSEIAT